MKIINYVKNLTFKLKIKIFRDDVKLKKHVKIDSTTFFEGCNLLAPNVVFKNSDIGFASYVGNNSFLYNTKIGKYSCIGPHVKIILGQHPTDFVSIHPCFFSTRKQSGFTYVSKDKFSEFKFVDKLKGVSVVIGNDVWICADVKILEGVTVGDGAIILPGAVVNTDVPPYAIVGGVPAKVIKYRFDKKNIDFLLKLKWWDKDKKWIESNAKYFDDIDSLKEHIKNE